MQGSDSDDIITGGNRNDVLDGGNGSDTLHGGTGEDILIGGGRDDTGTNHIDGGAGDDVLVAGGQKTSYFSDFFAANPALYTAVHSDAKYSGVASIVDGASNGLSNFVANDFQFHSANGHDAILNFHTETDKISIERGINGSDIQDFDSLSNHITVNENNVCIDLGLGNTITLVGIDPSTLSASDFVLV